MGEPYREVSVSLEVPSTAAREAANYQRNTYSAAPVLNSEHTQLGV